MTSTSPYWVSAFLDVPSARHDAAVAFWESVTGYDRSSTRGPHAEFVTLVPPEGDDYLRIQRVEADTPRIHLDLHVADPRAAAAEAVELGATLMRGHDDYVTLSSPGGFTFCFVSHPAAVVPPATDWLYGTRARVDQVCLDIPPAAYDVEFAFWEALTGWEARPPRPDVEFARLTPPPGEQPLQLLLQRLDDEEAAVRAHLDWCATDRDAEAQRQLAAGATIVERFERGWTVMRSPTGFTYCLTDRPPQDQP